MRNIVKTLLNDIGSAVAKNVKPGIQLQIFGLMIVLLYYFVPSTRPAYDAILRLRGEYGFLYSVVATMFFGALVPLLFLKALGRLPADKASLRAAALLLFWAWKGFEVDIFYRLQSFLFGTEPSVVTVIKKVAFDQFVYFPLLAGPEILLLYAWIDSGFSFAECRKKFGRVFFCAPFPPFSSPRGQCGCRARRSFTAFPRDFSSLYSTLFSVTGF